MPSTCAVADCRNTSDLKENVPGLIHHVFPVKNKDISNKWVHFCRKDKFNPKVSYRCSEHFTDDSYQRDLEHELLGLPPRKKLKVDAIPSIAPSRKLVQHECGELRKKRALKRKWNEDKTSIINRLLDSSSTDEDNSLGLDSHYPGSDKLTQTEVTGLTYDNVHRQLDSLWRLVECKDKKIATLTDKVRRLENRLNWTKNKLKIKNMISQRMKQIISPAQEKKISGKKRVNWSNEDIVKALSVRSVSLKSYETARTNWKLPLPCARTLRQWIKTFSCKPGILQDVIHTLKAESSNLDIMQRICILLFDEMSINSRFVIDKASHEIVSDRKVQVVMARGLCGNWKQPVYYDFDQNMTKDTLFKIIRALEGAGYPVHAITCDLGAENRSLWNDLNINLDSTYFDHPSRKNRQIHVFADVPHMLKLLRNHVLDDGIKLEEGTEITKQTFVKLINMDDTEIKHCPKLCHKLVEISGAERMRVKFAAQLFSRHVGCFATKVFKDNPDVADFIHIINDGFDVLNSRVPCDTNNPIRSALGMKDSEQLKALSDLRKLLFSMRAYTKKGNEKKTLLPFQKGWIISIDSTKNLMSDLKRMYNIKYLLTSRLTQDSLESLFSLIRAYGGPNTCPTVPEFKYRLRLLLVGSHVRPPSGANTDGTFENLSWVSAKLISRNKKSVGTRTKPAVQEKTASLIQPNNDKNHIEQLEYLAGYIAHKLKKRRAGPYQSSNTSQSTGNSWVHLLSRGGLQVPSIEFLSVITRCNETFESFFWI